MPCVGDRGLTPGRSSLRRKPVRVQPRRSRYPCPAPWRGRRRRGPPPRSWRRRRPALRGPSRRACRRGGWERPTDTAVAPTGRPSGAGALPSTVSLGRSIWLFKMPPMPSLPTRVSTERCRIFEAATDGREDAHSHDPRGGDQANAVSRPAGQGGSARLAEDYPQEPCAADIASRLPKVFARSTTLAAIWRTCRHRAKTKKEYFVVDRG